MNPRRYQTLLHYAYGVMFLAVMILGGTAAPSFVTDGPLELLMLVVAAATFLIYSSETAPRHLKLFVFACIAVVALQLVPLPAAITSHFQGVLPLTSLAFDPDQGWRGISLTPGRTLEALAWTISFGLLFLAFLRLPYERLASLMSFVLLVATIFCAVAFFQFTLSNAPSFVLFTGMTSRAAFFGDSNHFGTLAASIIPLAVFYLMQRGRFFMLLAFLLLITLVLLAAKSRFGGIAGALSLFGTILIVLPKSKANAGKFLLLFVVLVLVFTGALIRLNIEGVTEAVRETIFATTLTAIRDNLPFGIGFGGFVTAYPAYEALADIQSAYINRAHNDYLELVLDGGLPAAILMIWGLALIVFRSAEKFRSSFHLAMLLSISVMLIHSLIEFPLRTQTMCLLFIYVLALFFHPEHTTAEARKDHRRKRSRPANDTSTRDLWSDKPQAAALHHNGGDTSKARKSL